MSSTSSPGLETQKKACLLVTPWSVTLSCLSTYLGSIYPLCQVMKWVQGQSWAGTGDNWARLTTDTWKLVEIFRHFAHWDSIRGRGGATVTQPPILLISSWYDHLPIVLRTYNPIAARIFSLAATRAKKSIRMQYRRHNPEYAMWSWKRDAIPFCCWL